VVAQVRIPVLAGDTPEDLAARLIPREHALLVATVALAASGRLAERGDVVYCDGQPLLKPLTLDSAGQLTPLP
jgi:phosphoribosylglycinamide formyltransferase-1